SQIKEAQEKEKIVVLDLPTGSTPKSLWKPLGEMARNGELDLSKVIFMGHETAIGHPTLNGPVDYDKSRRNSIENVLGIEINKISNRKQVSEDQINGNYIVMDAGTGDDNETLAYTSAKNYDEILHGLRDRDDVTFIGLD